MKYRSFPFQLVTLYFFFGLLMIVSCTRENSLTNTDAQEEQVSSVSGESSAEAENIFSETFDDVMGVNNEVGIAGSGVFYGRPDTLNPTARCFTVTITHPNNSPFPAHVVIDFGTSGCMGPDGHIRKGKIISDYTNRLIYPGAMATTTFDGYYIDSIHVEGVHKISNISSGTASKVFKVEVINGKLTKPSGNFIEWNSLNTITQVEGLTTPGDPRDDIFKITGSAKGFVKRGNLLVRWESTITEPLIRRFTCRWIVKGRIRTMRLNLPNPNNSPWVAVLDFGNGGCDNQATITINGITHQITLP
ncbi:MAG TPA: hypothetical protein VN451_07890 [Chitinophagaceae bacterium]|nr:hypothetical protein [Chitinophagaceae bacterium]